MASSSSSSPCAACKFLRRKCTAECVFAPYFPPDQPHKFANVHKIFGASNITKLLNELAPHQREDAVNSLAYEADARVKDPVYGCVGTISLLQTQVARLKQELAVAQQELRRYSTGGPLVAPPGMVAGVSTHQAESSSPPVGVGHRHHHHHHYQTPPAQQQQQQQQQLHGIVEQPAQHQVLTRDQLVEIAREQHLTREQVMEIARIGGGSYEAGLAILGLCPIGPYPPSRPSGSGDPGSSGDRDPANSGAGGFYL